MFPSTLPLLTLPICPPIDFFVPNHFHCHLTISIWLACFSSSLCSPLNLLWLKWCQHINAGKEVRTSTFIKWGIMKNSFKFILVIVNCYVFLRLIYRVLVFSWFSLLFHFLFIYLGNWWNTVGYFLFGFLKINHYGNSKLFWFSESITDK